MVVGRIAGAGLVALSMLVPAPALAQEAEPPPEEPVAAAEPDVLTQATQLAAEGRWAQAAEKFRAALALADTAATRFNLAQAERNLGKLASAQREFVRARDQARREGAYDVHRLADDALAALAARVPKLVVALPKEARAVEARIDGQRVATSSSIALDPGHHELVVTAPGRDPFVRAFELREGQKLSVVVAFRARARQVPKARTARAPSSPPAASSGPPVATLLLAGAGVAAFTSAAVLHVRRNDKLDEAGEGCERSGGEFVCPVSRKSDPEHRDLIEAANRAELARDVLLGVGVGAWTAAALWWIFDADGSEHPVSASITPSAQGASARVRIAF